MSVAILYEAPRGWLTIIDVMRAMGIDPTPDLTWGIGGTMRSVFKQRYGRLPDKALRDKTNGRGGSHCFAVYPPFMRRDIEAVIRLYVRRGLGGLAAE